MEGNNLIKRGVTVAVILLFLGLAIAPSINANISKDKENKRTQEVLNGMENYDCIIHGKLTGSYCLIPYWLRFFEFSTELYIYNYMDRWWPIRKFIKIGLDSEFIFGYAMDVDYDPSSNGPSSGIITTIGSEGTLHWSGDFYGNISLCHYGFSRTIPFCERQDWYFFKAITGFRGIRIFLKGTCYFFGYADKVKVSSSTPPY